MADQRPPRHSGSPSRAAAPAATAPCPSLPSANNDDAASDQPSLSTQSSFQSLETYDERDLRDCEHAPSKDGTSHATNNDAAASSANRRHNLITRRQLHAPPEFGNDVDYYPSPVMKSGHRRRRPMSCGTKNKEHQSPKPQYSVKRRPFGGQSSKNVGYNPASVPMDASANAANLLPVLRELCRALLIAGVAKSKAVGRKCKYITSQTFGRKWVRYILYLIGAVIAFLLICLSMVVYGCYQEAMELCTPPPYYRAPINEPPLIEYFVHGRGNGHYARSVAIIEKLNEAGVDVRMFIGRATMWRAVHESHLSSEARAKHGTDTTTGGDSNEIASHVKRRGTTTAIAVTSITPEMGVFDTLSHILERITGDCEVAHQTGRYPTLVVTDGDVPGMVRAWFGSIPSVGISHGQTFAIGRKPKFVKDDARLNAAWNHQLNLNWRSAFLTNWQIGTSFAAMDTRRPSGVIAMSPMRPEAVGMADERWRRRRLGSPGDAKTGPMKTTKSTEGMTTTSQSSYLTPEQRGKIDRLLLGSRKGQGSSEGSRRKLVICYFRDKNGDVMLNALLRSGFDVLLFERGYHKGLMNIQGVEKFGHKWIVHRDGSIEEELTDMAIDDYWRRMLEGTNAKLLEDEASKPVNVSAPNTAAKKDNEVQEDDIQDDFEERDLTEPRIIRVTNMSLFIPLLSIADGVASSAGSQLISECIYSGLPILSLYRTNDDEQMLNVMIYRNLVANDKETDPTGIGKVVHGISHEEFSGAFSFLAVDDSNFQSVDHTTDTATSKLLTKEQEFLLLRDPKAKRAYQEFDAFVDAISRSQVSSSYYEEAGVDSGRKGISEDENVARHNPFQGMPDAAPVMLEILKEVISR